MRRRIMPWAIALTVIAVLAGAAAFYYPQDVLIDAQGFKYRLGHPEDEVTGAVHVRIEGKMYKSFTGNRRFNGTVELEGEEMPVPENQRQIDINFGRNNWATQFLYAYVDPHGRPQFHSVGSMYVSRDFSQVVIALNEPEGDGRSGWNGGDGLMLAAPAEGRAEAVALSNKLMADYLNGQAQLAE